MLENLYDFVKKHSEMFIIAGLGIIFSLLFFFNLGNYYLMDVDETRYVAMARDMFHSKDFLTLYLNGEFFFEKPPLYFWNECMSFFLFGGKINEFTARFPVALLGFILAFVTYFTSKHWVNRKFGIVSSLILATSVEFLILSKYAILDMVLTFYVCLALICFISTYFCQEKHEKIYWWLFYIFTGLGAMAKGIPAPAIAFGGAFICSLITGSLKKMFKPVNFLVGIILFTLIILPWHIIMLKIHGSAFFDEYIIKHHWHRFFNSQDIGRKRPFLYYFGVVLWGFIPWIFSSIAVLIERLKNITKNKFYEKYKKFSELDNTHKLIYLASVLGLWIMLFFSSSSTKLATYILPIYYPLALICGFLWVDYTENKMHTKPINISVITVGTIFTIAGTIALFSGLFLPADINYYINDIKILWACILIVFGILSIVFVKCKKYTDIFALYVVFMMIVSMFGTKQFFEVDYKFGQNDLVEFAKYAQSQNKTISANGMNRKYSLIYYNNKIADYNNEDMDINVITEDLNRKDNLVILKLKNFEQIKDNLKCNIVKTGKRYIMIEGL